jgi:hypothetical protein
VGSGARNLSRKQLLSLYVRPKGVQPVGVGPGGGGLQMWKHVSQDDVCFVSSDQ